MLEVIYIIFGESGTHKSEGTYEEVLEVICNDGLGIKVLDVKEA